jgi:hypothetical protein
MATKTYRVEWSILMDGESEEDAARQAWATLDDATMHNYGATVLFVSDEYGDDRVVLDMEDVLSMPTCDCEKYGAPPP